MDDRMAKNAMVLLSYCPLIFLINGYWMLSNRQMFENIVNKVTLTTDQMRSDHKLSDMFGMS